MKIKVTMGTISKAVDALDKLIKDFENTKKLFLEKLAEVGVDTAKASFRNAQYDGINDVQVLEPYWDGDKLIIEATGKAITFIEFGTGLKYSENHPLAEEMGFKRGEYGKGRGKNKAWFYYGERGSSGEYIRTHPKKGDVIKTRGNPANRSMYEAAKEMRAKVLDIAREVFFK